MARIPEGWDEQQCLRLVKIMANRPLAQGYGREQVSGTAVVCLSFYLVCAGGAIHSG